MADIETNKSITLENKISIKVAKAEFVSLRYFY